MRTGNKSILPIISLALLAAAESHPQRRSAATSLTDQYDISFNLDTKSSMTNICDYRLTTKRKRRLGGKGLERRTEHGGPEPITVKLDRIGKTDLWTGDVALDRDPMSVGNPKFAVVFDTALGDFRLMTSISKGSVKDLKLYKPPADKQQQAGHHFKGDYATPEYTGAAFEDTIHISGAQVAGVHIVGLTQVDATRRIGADGSLGMSFDTNPAVAKLHFFTQFSLQYRDHPKIFAFYFGHHAELHLGGIKKSAYLGEIEYHNVVPVKNELLFWTIKTGVILVDHLGHELTMMRTFFNTGSQVVHGPYNQVKLFYDKIGGFEREHQGRKYFMFDCKAVRPVISFKWGSRVWLYDDFGKIESGGICIGGIQAKTYEFDPEIWSIGTRWMKRKCLIFNKQEQKVGIAIANLSHGQ
ncbi:hypothetical protein APHAL10511_008116 [Amanita phalloides]|nr:hypothetical protein APHAL10511_008116 [Amanita phalloides]